MSLLLLLFGLLNIAVILIGYLVVNNHRLALSWLMLAASVTVACLIFWDCHPIIKMLGIIATTFTAMKVVAVTQSYSNKPMLTFKQWFMFAAGWAGMRAEPFEKLGGPKVAGGNAMIRVGVSRVIAGIIIILLARYIAVTFDESGIVTVMVSVLLLVGFSLVLHFGLLGISAGMWRHSGVNTYLLFRQPAKAATLAEFWGKRWNLAFVEMSAVTVYRPVKRIVGSKMALMASFLFSGLLHELALSLPVNAGYGLPTLYFFIQGLLVIMEKALQQKYPAIFRHPLAAKLWLFCSLALPAPLLFHPWFLKGILWPLAGLYLQ